ncbi:MAG: 4a-hydroxytetrahydrobiopterin dehydratase [Betaproteobacteria bacterium]|jgi:4a-hydroxytetrahydrobiopterin dehydratase
MLTRAQLLARTSRALEGHAAMTEAQVQAQLAAVPDWALVNGALERSYRFANYHETIAFVNALAFVVHREDHHPDLAVSYNRCTVRFNTHSVGGISENDFICAAKADALHAQHFGAG